MNEPPVMSINEPGNFHLDILQWNELTKEFFRLYLKNHPELQPVKPTITIEEEPAVETKTQETPAVEIDVWTPYDLEMLKDNYADYGAEKLIKKKIIKHKTIDQIMKKARELGLIDEPVKKTIVSPKKKDDAKPTEQKPSSAEKTPVPPEQKPVSTEQTPVITERDDPETPPEMKNLSDTPQDPHESEETPKKSWEQIKKEREIRKNLSDIAAATERERQEKIEEENRVFKSRCTKKVDEIIRKNFRELGVSGIHENKLLPDFTMTEIHKRCLQLNLIDEYGNPNVGKKRPKVDTHPRTASNDSFGDGVEP